MRIDWYFDFISPFAYLQWPLVRDLAQHRPVNFRPVLLAGLLDAMGTKGPAELPAKRRFTYRLVLWRARQAGRPLRFPPAHPFNPLPALRLALAAGLTVAAIDAIFEHIWAEGRGTDLDALRPLGRRLGVDDADAAVASDAVKAHLRANFEAALAAQVFGVPTFDIDGDLFWGEDASELVMARVADPGLFEEDAFRHLDALPVGAQRRPKG